MPKIDGHEIATKIFERSIDAVRDYAKEMENAIVDVMEKTPESKKSEFLKDWGAPRLARTVINLGDMVQPLEHIKDKVSQCKSSAELESVVDSLIKLSQDKVDKVQVGPQTQWDVDMCAKYLQMLAALALEMNDYCIKQYFPAERDFVDAKIKVSKGFMTPATLAPIKVYFGSDCIQHAYAIDKGEWVFKLPKGKEFTFWSLKDGKEVSKSVFLSGDTKIKL